MNVGKPPSRARYQPLPGPPSAASPKPPKVRPRIGLVSPTVGTETQPSTVNWSSPARLFAQGRCRKRPLRTSRPPGDHVRSRGQTGRPIDGSIVGRLCVLRRRRGVIGSSIRGRAVGGRGRRVRALTRVSPFSRETRVGVRCEVAAEAGAGAGIEAGVVLTRCRCGRFAAMATGLGRTRAKPESERTPPRDPVGERAVSWGLEAPG
jgi:hypothetical protein